MKMFHFEKPFDFRPAPNVKMHYAAGSVRKLPEAQVEAALAAGVGKVDETATEEVIVDDTPQLASVVRADLPSVQAARPVAPAPEKPAKAR